MYQYNKIMLAWSIWLVVIAMLNQKGRDRWLQRRGTVLTKPTSKIYNACPRDAQIHNLSQFLLHAEQTEEPWTCRVVY